MQQYKNNFDKKLLMLSFSAIQSRLMEDDDCCCCCCCSMECDDEQIAHSNTIINDQYIITYDDFYAVDSNMIID